MYMGGYITLHVRLHQYTCVATSVYVHGRLRHFACEATSACMYTREPCFLLFTSDGLGGIQQVMTTFMSISERRTRIMCAQV